LPTARRFPYGKEIAETVNLWGNCSFQGPANRSEVKLNFLGYSGGGQIAYTTAQRLSGRLFVDNLVMFGSPWRAYNGTNNIGHIWEVWAQGDLNYWYLDPENNYGGMAYHIVHKLSTLT
jgi:hypothetical protein